MGLARRPYPLNLAGKLLQVRMNLGLSQNEMLRALGMDETHNRSTVSGYERGEREPPLPILLKYARLARVSVESLIDDDLKLETKRGS
jgi:transcriptional regulator with XRE-family HTH domain